MIYITGDTHADFITRLSEERFPIQSEMTKSKYLIICDDLGRV